MNPLPLVSQIRVLSDREAIRAITALAEDRGLLDGARQLPSGPDQLQDSAGTDDLAAFAASDHAKTSDGDLARLALEYVAGLSALADAVEEAVAYVRAPAERVEPVSVSVAALVIVLLQTEVKFTRNTNGKWSLTVHKKAMRDSTLGKLLAGLTTHFINGK